MGKVMFRQIKNKHEYFRKTFQGKQASGVCPRSSGRLEEKEEPTRLSSSNNDAHLEEEGHHGGLQHVQGNIFPQLYGGEEKCVKILEQPTRYHVNHTSAMYSLARLPQSFALFAIRQLSEQVIKLIISVILPLTKLQNILEYYDVKRWLLNIRASRPLVVIDSSHRLIASRIAPRDISGYKYKEMKKKKISAANQRTNFIAKLKIC